MLGAQWSEINLSERMWVVPPPRMKTGKTTGKEHRVPLSDAAISIIEAMARIRVDEHVFPGRKGALGHMALLRVLTALRPGVKVHGFRSTFRDWAAEATAYPREAAEMALAHAIGNQAEAAYRRGDLFEKRRALMRDWALHCGSGEP